MEIRSSTNPTLHPLICQHGVLVVDDSRVQRNCGIGLLRHLGVEKIYEAEDGSSALQLVRKLSEPPAAVLLDLEMPGMDGIELVQQLSVGGWRPSLIVISGADDSLLYSVGTLIQSLNLPLLGIIHKPLSEEALLQSLMQFHLFADATAKKQQDDAPPVSLHALLKALDQNLLGPYYQPKVSLSTGQMHGMEALARWRNPDGSLIPPASFIDVAENNGLIGRLTLTLLDGVLNDLRHWHSHNFFPVVALNLSAKLLSEGDFAAEIMRRVEAAGISPRCLVLELTESAVVCDIALAIGALGRLRLKGFGLSIDDYGTGFSSMQLLSLLPFTELKIDRSFVRHANEKWNLRVILESTITIGHRLGISTVAEGIETEEELALLAAMGCKYAQGFLLAHPMPADEIMGWQLRETPRLHQLCSPSAAKLPQPL